MATTFNKSDKMKIKNETKKACTFYFYNESDSVQLVSLAKLHVDAGCVGNVPGCKCSESSPNVIKYLHIHDYSSGAKLTKGKGIKVEYFHSSDMRMVWNGYRFYDFMESDSD